VSNDALILLGLLDGQGNFDESVSVTSTCGWDVDCNAGNLGCLLGIRGGLAAFEGGYDWRGPLADRLFLSTADGGRAISDALSEALVVANAGRALAGLPPLAPKDGARFHFSLPGSVQGFQAEGACLANPRGEGLEIILEPSNALEPARAATATFILPGDLGEMGGYPLLASPTLYPGQAVRARLKADPANPTRVQAGLFLRYYSATDQAATLSGPQVRLAPGEEADLAWTVPDPDGGPVFEIGIQAAPTEKGAAACRLTLDRLGWSGSPMVEFRRPQRSEGGYAELWRRAWVNAVDHWENRFNHAFRIIQDRGRGMLITGARDWQDYRVSAQITSAMFASGGIAARVQGLERYYALELVRGGSVRLLKALDGERILGETEFDWRIWQPYDLALEVRGAQLRGWVDGNLVFDLVDDQRPLLGGGIALTVTEGHLASHAVRVD
jgi:hypothetical protein